MRKILIAALVLAAGCDATRRDYTHCDTTYSDCEQGFVCNPTTGRCERERADASEAPWPYDAGTEDAMPGEAGQDVGRDVSIMEGGTIDGVPGMVDGSAGEVSTQGEAGGIDGGVPDAPGSCFAATDCTSSLLPFCVNGMCVACKDSSHCSNLGGTPFCTAQNTCVSCAQAPASFCASSTPILPACDSVSGRCVECTASTQCKDAAKPVCLANTCVECASNSHCTKDPAKAFCASNHTCGGCNAPGASAGSGGVDGGAPSDGGSGIDGGVLPACLGAKPVCATTGDLAGQCVECQDNTACANPTLPICTNNTCSKCTSDSQCTAPPRICMFHLSQDAGRCATEAETIYVKNSSSCTGGLGTATSPYCDTQAAVNAVTSTKRVILVKGPATDVLAPISSTPAGALISIIGQDNPTTSAGAAFGIHVTAGDVYIRGLTVANGTSKVGIQVDSGATLRLDRCFVVNNAGGGLLVQSGASFDIRNTVFHKNGGGQVGPVDFGGVYLAGSAPNSGPSRFWFNTITENQQAGVVCADSSQPLFGVLIWQNVNGAWKNCSLAITRETDAMGNPRVYATDSMYDSGEGNNTSPPAFATTTSIPYRLTRNSPCRDYIPSTAPTTDFPIDDIDGVLRPFPTGGSYDCGASEFRP